MLMDEVRQLLRELARDVGAVRTSVVHGQVERSSAHVHITPLGSGAFLRIQMPDPDAPPPAPGEPVFLHGRPPALDDIQRAATITRCVRALRACARRWDRHQVPACSEKSVAEPGGHRVRERIRAFLEALANSHQAEMVAVSIGLDIIAANRPLDELSRERIPFIVRRVDVEAERRQTSHAELAGQDFYARSFWFSACLVLFFNAPYAEDFVRHRARMVCRELVPLLTMLDEPPPSPAQIAPVPDP